MILIWFWYNDIHFNVEGKVSDDDLSSFIDDSETNENVCKNYRLDKVTQFVESALEDTFIQSSRELEFENDVINFCENSDNELSEVDEFENPHKKLVHLETFC